MVICIDIIEYVDNIVYTPFTLNQLGCKVSIGKFIDKVESIEV